mgnify:CR=1 FL=1
MTARQFILLAIAIIFSPPLLAATADDVVCDKCVHGSDLAGWSVGAGKLKKQSVTRPKIAPRAVGAAQIETKTVQKRVTGKCPPASFITSVNQNGSVECKTLLFAYFSNSDPSGVVAAVCPSDTNVQSVSCDCDYMDGTRNFGVLFSCAVAGNGGVAGCFNEAATYNPYLPPPMATARVVCQTVVEGLTTQSKSSDEVDQELTDALRDAQNRALDHSARFQAR